MSNIFSYESKLMQMLLPLGDIIILNILYLLFCIPVFTIGAAQAGLYNGIKVLLDKEDESSCAKAFFRGFKSGFGTITISWLILSLCIALCAYSLMLVLVFHYAGLFMPVELSIAALCACGLYQSLLPQFHARFGCTLGQLMKNCWLLLIAHPLRSILVFILTWAPVGLLAWNSYYFMKATPIFICGYYSVAFMLNFLIMKKPFGQIIDEFQKNHSEEAL